MAPPRAKAAAVTSSLHPTAKAGIVAGGFVAALLAAWGAMAIRQSLNGAAPSQGMQAFGDWVVGVTVFSALAIIPSACGLYWLRPVARFWTVLVNVAVACTLTGPFALPISGPLRAGVGNWAMLSDLRFATLPLSSLAWATCTLFAPAARLRWLFLGAALIDAVLFAAVIFVKFILPGAR